MIRSTMLAALVIAAPAAAQTARPTLIRNATVITMSGAGTLQNTDVLLRDGRIAAIGRNLQAPSGAATVDATGKFLLPGIIDPHSHMMSDGINEGSLSITSMVRIADVLDPTRVNIYRALAGGTTTLNILHGSANTIGGQSAVVKLKWGRPLSEMMFPGAKPGIKFALGENVTRKNSSVTAQTVRRYPTTRMGQAEVIRDAFARAKDYQAEWNDYRARLARREQNLVPPRRDLELEPLVEVLEGKRQIHSHGYRADEMLTLLEIADEYGFKVAVLQHALDAYKIAPEIAAHGASISTFADMWGYKIEAYDAIPHNAAIATRAGVLTTLNSDDDGRARRMNVEAAKTVRYGGLSEEEALALVTINAARQLEIDSRVGSIEVGKDADVVIWNAHPLSVYARVDRTFIDGEVFFDRETDLKAREEAAARRAELEKAEPNQLPAARGGQGGGRTPAQTPGQEDNR